MVPAGFVLGFLNMVKEPHYGINSGEVPFAQLISNEDTLRGLLEASCISGPDATTAEMLQAWVEQRKFIADTITKSGKVLDYGCANGFLLRCLQEWSTHELEPWGIDVNEDALQQAKKLFANSPHHFMTPQEFVDGEKANTKFEYVYWNVWDNYSFSEGGITLLNKLIEVTETGGRTALGFYDTKDKNIEKVTTLISELGLESRIVENPHGEEVILYIDKT